MIQKKPNVEQLAEVEKMRHVFFHLSTRVKAILNAYGKRMSHSPGALRRLQNLVFMLENKINGVIAMSIAQCQQDQVWLWLDQTYIFIYIYIYKDLYLVTLINFNLFYFYFAWLEDLDSEKEDANQKDGSISNGDGN